ncbi:hypothetical protein PG996_008566 [Apiospora saccharicola]|uniref:Uncharacterized protein n=1 Tax=Apiospora saccharicola TaxID=335842 RepID=A0ABR1UY99_9PEZI
MTRLSEGSRLFLVKLDSALGAGAVLLAKTNLGEQSQFRNRNTVSRWSVVGKADIQTLHGRHGALWPAGAATEITAAALGTETHRSTVTPASYAGLVDFGPYQGCMPLPSC